MPRGPQDARGDNRVLHREEDFPASQRTWTHELSWSSGGLAHIPPDKQVCLQPGSWPGMGSEARGRHQEHLWSLLW